MHGHCVNHVGSCDSLRQGTLDVQSGHRRFDSM
nr:MAG TPA: hypothetical protein [Caudoviricetes sp.]